MSSLAEIPTSAPRRSAPLRIVFWLLLFVLVVFGGLGGYAFYAAHSALPQLDGRLQVNGLYSSSNGHPRQPWRADD